MVRDAADPVLSKAERGRLVGALADGEHVGPDGWLVRIGRTTLDRWVRAYRAGGFQALVPRPRVVAPRTQAQVLELAFSLKRERPERTAAQVREIMLAAGDSERVPGLRTLQTHLARAGLNAQAWPDGMTVPETTATFTVRLPVSVIAAARAGAVRCGAGVGALTAAALRSYLAHEGRSHRGSAG